MRKRIAQWGLGIAAGVMLALLLLLYTPPGLALVGRLVEPLTGGQVRIEELGGFFPNHLHAGRVQVSDRKGIWLEIEQASLDWSAPAMFGNHIAIDAVSASRIVVQRRPLPSGTSSGKTPIIDIARLSAPRILLAAPVIGHALTLSAAGSLHYISIHQLAAGILVTRLDNRDSYRVAGAIANDIARGTITIHEGSDGILGKLVNLPGLGPVNLSAGASGDAAANNVTFQLSAGPLRATGHGVISLASHQANLDAVLSAPAMTPAPGISWQALSAEAHIHGRFDAPRLVSHLLLTNGMFQGVSIQTLALDLAGDAGHASLTGQAQRVVLPGSHPDLVAGAPVRLTAEADLRNQARPLRFSVTHPLFRLQGTAQTAGALRATADLALPSLAPLATLVGTAVDGDAGFHLSAQRNGSRIEVALEGRINSKGDAMAPRLLGNAKLAATASLEGADLMASQVQLSGAALHAEAEGDVRAKIVNYRFALSFSDLSRLARGINGSLSLRGAVNGPIGKIALSAGGEAILASPGFARQRVNIDLKADGLPQLGNAMLSLDGRMDGAPLAIHATLGSGKTRQARLRARWLSLDTTADMTIGAGNALAGTAHLALRRLNDIKAFTDIDISGAAEAKIIFSPQQGKTNAVITAGLTGLHAATASFETATLKGSVSDALGKPGINAELGLSKISLQGWSGDARVSLHGPLDQLGIILDSAMTAPDTSPLKAHAAAVLDLSHKQMTLTAFSGDWHNVRLALGASSTLHFANGLALDHLAVHLGNGRITADGQISPQLSLNVSAAGISLADFRSFAPQIGVQGTVAANAVLRGTLGAPTGRIVLRAQDLRTFFSRSAPATIAVTAQLMGDHAELQTSADAGAAAHLVLAGTVPLTATGTIALHSSGKLDLVLLDAFTAAAGRRVRGMVTVNGDVGGTVAAPHIAGHAELANGEFQDYAQGVRVRDISATLSADGTHLTLTRLRGVAGPGLLTASGHVDLMAADMPIDVEINATEARPVANDLISASLSGQLTLRGHVRTNMALAGKMQVTSGEIDLPQNFPPDVAVLNVRRRGRPPLPPPPKQSRVGLDLDIRTSGPVFVRGRGVDAEMAGAIQVTGTMGAPIINGGLRMERGSFTVVGQTLQFTDGRIRFDGTGLRNRLDPALDFSAQTVSGGVTATLAVTGYASAPKIALSSTPALPQDEVIAHLLFQQSVKQLTPLQLASIAQAAAAMGGLGGGFDPLAAVRRNLGLDRLSVGSAQGGASGTESQTTVEAGRYVTRNVYVGVKQNLSGGTQTQVQVDITRRLKAQATLSTSASATTAQGNALQDNGSSIGLSYQFEY